MLGSLYKEWNEKINVISRKDIENLYINHVLHSLGIAKVISFVPGTIILDVGTGGGFPGIPLAILFPEVRFHLVDSIGKKITVVQEISAALGLQNVAASKARAEELDDCAFPWCGVALHVGAQFLSQHPGRFQRGIGQQNQEFFAP